MLSSESIGEVATAMAKFQGEMPEIAKVKKGAFGKYARLEDILPLILPVLSRNGLCLTQHPWCENGIANMETRVTHTSGQFLACRMAMKPEKQTLQGMGGALTYLRRYSLCPLLGIAADEDDDGANATRGEAVAEARERRQQPPKAESRRDVFLKHISQTTKIERLGDAKQAVVKARADGELSEGEAAECLSAIGDKTAALASQPAPTGELFDSTPVNEGVGV